MPGFLVLSAIGAMMCIIESWLYMTDTKFLIPVRVHVYSRRRIALLNSDYCLSETYAFTRFDWTRKERLFISLSDYRRAGL